MDNDQKRELRARMSGSFYTDFLPDNWNDPDFDIDQWCEDHTWEPFENLHPDDVWQMLLDTSSAAIDWIEKNLETYNVEEK